MTGPFASGLFRVTFVLAGCYNIAFGLWAALWPAAFFAWFALEPPRYPAIWACLGMVVGLYGLLYLHAARKLHAARPIVAVGLMGKVLGPIGMLLAFGADWPFRLGLLAVWNDLIWWLPFGLFLARGTAVARHLTAAAPWSCAALHALAMLALVTTLRGGLLIEPDAARRAAYIAERTAAWAGGWIAFALAAASVVAFYAWWGGRLAEAPARSAPPLLRPAAMLGVLLAGAGMVFDLTGHGISVLVLLERAPAAAAAAVAAGAWEPAAFTAAERTATLLTAGAANGLYTLGGVVLMLATPDLPHRVRAAMWATWSAGAAMTLSAAADSSAGLVAATGVLFPLLIGWVVWMGRSWRAGRARGGGPPNGGHTARRPDQSA